jgi:SDR family mycofactocin-dependent oxidoreductase
MGRFEGRVAMITGGARGQGRSHAIALAREGADIAVCDVAAQIATVGYPMGTPEELEETEHLVEKEGRRCLAAELDTRDFAALQRFVEQTVAEFGRLDLAVANAGIASAGVGIDVMTPEQWNDMIGTDLTGVFHTIRTVSPQMKRQGFGRIVATSSMLGRQGCGYMAHYCAAKWGVIGLVKSAAIELAPFGITVNAVAPGNIRTPMVVNDAMVETLSGGNPDATFDDVLPLLGALHVLPMALLEPEDVTNAILFLFSDDARAMTGAVLDVSAGNTSRNTA